MTQKKSISPQKLKEIENQIFVSLAECEQILNDLKADNADYEGAYAYIEDCLREIVSALEQFEEYDEKNCAVWSHLAGRVLGFLDRIRLQYNSLTARHMIPSDLDGVGDYLDTNKDQLSEIARKVDCNLSPI